MKIAVALAMGAGLFVAAPRERAELAFHPKSGLQLHKTYDQTATLELSQVRIRLGGDDIPQDSITAPKIALARTLHAELEDDYDEVRGGRVHKLTRHFGDLSGKESATLTTDQGSGTDDRERTSPLESKTVQFVWDEKAGARVASSQDAGVSQAILDDLEFELDLLTFLPDDAEASDWDVDPSAVRYLLGWGGDLAWRFDEATDAADLDRQFVENASGTIRAKAAGEREADGARLAVIELALAIDSTGEGENLSPGMNGVQKAKFSIELAGELLWDVESGVFRSLALEGDGKVVFANEGEANVQERQVHFEQEREFKTHAKFALVARRAE